VRRDLTWPILIGWTVLVGLAHLAGPSAVSWHSFVHGTRLLLSPAAAHLYALHSALQIGPVAYLADAPVVFGLPAGAGRIAAMAAMSLLGLLLVDQLRRLAAPADRRARRRFLIAGLALLLVWEQLAITYVHPDDALALVLAVIALRLVRAERPVAAAVLLALAADSKPWALAFVAILALARSRRRLALAAWAGVVAAAWLPFYLLDPRSTAATTFRIRNVATSSLRVLGVHAAATPSWDRPVQIGLGAALALVAVRRGRWPAVILIAALLWPLAASAQQAGAPAALKLPQDLSPWGMFQSADSLVKAVMIGLALASVITWTVLLAKGTEIWSARRKARRAIAALGQAKSLAEATERAGLDQGPVAALVRAAAAEVLAMTPVVDVLINNAGIMMQPEFSTTPEGVERHFGVNHLGHFLFANLLMPALLRSPAGPRVVVVSSAGNRGQGIRFDDVNFGEGKHYEPFLAYAQSKTANLLFVLSLAQKLGSKNLVTFGVDPGSKWPWRPWRL